MVSKINCKARTCDYTLFNQGQPTVLQYFKWHIHTTAKPLLIPIEHKENVMFVLTQHGGHMGFFEGTMLFPQRLTWMDKVIIGYANSICQRKKEHQAIVYHQAMDCTELKGKA